MRSAGRPRSPKQKQSDRAAILPPPPHTHPRPVWHRNLYYLHPQRQPSRSGHPRNHLPPGTTGNLRRDTGLSLGVRLCNIWGQEQLSRRFSSQILLKRQAEPPPVQAPRSELIIFATLAVSLNMPVHHPLSPHLMRDRKGTPTCTLGTATCKFSIALPWHSTYVATDHLTNCFWRTPHEAYNATSPRSHRSRQQGTKHLLPLTPLPVSAPPGLTAVPGVWAAPPLQSDQRRRGPFNSRPRTIIINYPFTYRQRIPTEGLRPPKIQSSKNTQVPTHDTF